MLRIHRCIARSKKKRKKQRKWRKYAESMRTLRCGVSFSFVGDSTHVRPLRLNVISRSFAAARGHTDAIAAIESNSGSSDDGDGSQWRGTHTRAADLWMHLARQSKAKMHLIKERVARIAAAVNQKSGFLCRCARRPSVSCAGEANVHTNATE